MEKKFIEIKIEVPEDVLYVWMLAAHEENSTLNEFINKALESHIKNKEK